MSQVCAVQGCGAPASFSIFTYNYSEPAKGKSVLWKEPDKKTSALCSSHALINELFAEGPREPGSRIWYPFTKEVDQPGYTVYALQKGADDDAHRLAPFLPAMPATLANASRVLVPEIRTAIQAGLLYEFGMEETCSAMECGLPATFETWEFRIDRDGQSHLHEREAYKVCASHASRSEQVRKFSGEYHINVPKGGILIYRPIIPGEMRLPEPLRGLVHDFTELTPELEKTLVGLLRAKLAA